jgi:hypothetical protein
MNGNAAYRETVNPRVLLASIAVLISTAMVFAGFAGTASAVPLSKDGKIHACYKVKGKPRGALRVVRSSKARCRKGERRVAWSVTATSGAPGQQGSQGHSGAAGAASSNEALLKEQVDALLLRVAALEGVLQGVTNGDLLGAVAAVPLVDALCEQTPELVEQVNTLQSVIGDLGLEPALELIGLLEIPTLPTPLEPFRCS